VSGSLGEAWLEIARRILAEGRESTYDGLPILEVAHATLVVDNPDPDDALIAAHANPERLAWMRANFVDRALVAELGDARSYASRLFDYAGTGIDQVQWVIDRLRDDPTSRSATITTFEPLLDTTYIPCVSMLDFWIPAYPAAAAAVDLVVYAHSIDFGSKGYGNLVQLADLQQRVAASLDRPVGSLTFIVKSAHVYATEFEYMRGVLAAVP
jgi:thymidylate synthase